MSNIRNLRTRKIYCVCVWPTPYWKHPNTAAFCLLEHPSDFFLLSTHMPTIHMHTHHSKVMNPDTSSRENVEMIWLILRKSVISRILLFIFLFFYRGSLCCFSLLCPDSTRVQHLKHEEPHIFISMYLASDMLSHIRMHIRIRMPIRIHTCMHGPVHYWLCNSKIHWL